MELASDNLKAADALSETMAHVAGVITSPVLHNILHPQTKESLVTHLVQPWIEPICDLQFDE